MSTVQVYAGFSPLNRALLYTSALLGPAQTVAGVGHSGLSSLGFLVFNWYSQIIMYRAATRHELHALSLVTPHANTTLAIAYMAGIFSGNRVIAPFLALGAVGVMWLNNATAWVAWKFNMPEGYGEWEFFFFGWRTLTPGWRKFIAVWQGSNSPEVFALMLACITYAIQIVFSDRDLRRRRFRWWHRIPMIPVGAAMSTLIIWPHILWMELIVRRNNIESETDWGAVYAFVAQVALLFMPSFGLFKEDHVEYLSLGRMIGFIGD